MGFDIECIIDIHSYPGEYFCPVCRTLVYPNEALQAQCTHLYCKPCLVHIANGTKACPYDGYLVTESDSKPLAECDKALTEKIGKVKVHCLYFRSGCTWEGALSDCSSHCSACSFGNSPVICNRCGIQIVHRQVHDHAQICPGGYDGQQTSVGAAGSTRSGTTSTPVTAQTNQTAAHSGAPVPQPQNPQNVLATQLPGQNLQSANTQANANAHMPGVAPASMPAPDQWYQQQYQQYYQQYGGYDPYQQQQIYPPQQQPFQQYPQHVVQMQGQPQSHGYSQPQGQAPQPHPQFQPPQPTNPATQASQQPHLQPQVLGQAQSLSQTQHQMLPQAPLAQSQLPPQGQAQVSANAPAQALPPNYQVSQPQTHPAMRPQTQIPPQGLPPPPQGQPPLPPQFPQAVGMRPPMHPQHPQVPQYQQGQGQMHHPQGSQAHLHPPMNPQTQAYIQSSNQSNAQSQPQTQLYQSHSQIPVFHSQTNQTAAPSVLPQAPHPPGPPVTGHHSYQQPHTAQTMQPGAPQHPAVLPNLPTGSIHPVQVYGQAPQQNMPIRPPHSHGSFSQQQPSAPLPLQNQVPGIPPAQHQQFPPHGQQPNHPIQHLPAAAAHPIQQTAPHTYAQQQQFSAPFHGQFHQQGHFTQQTPTQSNIQMRPPGPPQPQQSQNYSGIPMMPNQALTPQSQPLSGAFGASGHSGPVQGDSTSNQNQNQNYAKSMVPEQNVTAQEIRSPSKVLVEKGFESDSLKEVGTVQNGRIFKDADDSAKDGLVKYVVKQEKGDIMGSREPANEEKTLGAGGVENGTRKEEVQAVSNSVPLKQADSENLMKISASAGFSSGNFGDGTITAIPGSSMEGHTLAPESHGSHQERSKVQPSSTVGLQGHPGQSVNLTEEKVPGNLIGPSIADAHGFMGKPPPVLVESQSGSQHVVRTVEGAISNDQMPGSGEWRPNTKNHSDELNHMRMNGGAAHDPSMIGARDVNSKSWSKEHINSFTREPTRTTDQGQHSQNFPHHKFPYHSPGKDYLGSPSRGYVGRPSFPHGTVGSEGINFREAHRFGEGSRSSNPSSDFVRNPFHDGRFPPLPGQLQRGDNDDPRFGEHRVPGLPHNQFGSDDVFGPDGPGHLMKGKFSGPGYMTSHFNMGETTGPGMLPGYGHTGEGMGNFPRPPFSESVRGEMPNFLHHREPPMRNNYPYPGMPNAAQFSGGVDSFNESRKRRPVSNGWCRICEYDCETVERLEMHSQTRDHQNMAMDIVKHIKLQNKRMQRAAGGHMAHERGSRTRKVGTFGLGNKP